MEISHNGKRLPDLTPTGGPYLTNIDFEDSGNATWTITMKGGRATATVTAVAPSPPQTFVGARIHATSTQSVADSTNTDLVYQSVLFDTDSMANLGSDNRILTVHTAGIYLVIAETIWPYNNSGRRINVVTHNQFYSAGAIPSKDQASDSRMAVWAPLTGGVGTTNTSIGIFQAAPGDFFASGAFQASGVSLAANGGTNCFLSAVLIGI